MSIKQKLLKLFFQKGDKNDKKDILISIKQKLSDDEISYKEACMDYYNELTKKDVDFIIEKLPWVAAKHLNQHPFFKKEHVDIIVEKSPWAAAEYLSHRFSEENISYIANNHPEILKELESTIVTRLTNRHLKELSKNNVTFFYDKVTKESYRIEIVETDGKKDVVVSFVPTGLGLRY